MATIDVTLSNGGSGGTPSASPEPVNLKAGVDRLRYLSSGDTYTIKFSNSPFTMNGFRVTPASPVTCTQKAGMNGDYKYSIDDADTGLHTDPTVIIRP